MDTTKTEELLEDIFEKLDAMTVTEIIQGVDDPDKAMQDWQALERQVETADSLMKTFSGLEESFNTFTELVYSDILTALTLKEDYDTAQRLTDTVDNDLLYLSHKLSDLSFKLIRFVNR